VLSGGASIALPNMDPSLNGQAGILGSKFDDTITGTGLGDVLWGGVGSDLLDGQAGDDTLVGGSGVDTLLGGAGNDQFVVTSDEFNLASGGGFTFTVGGKDYSGGAGHYLYSDVMDGGTGVDTLNVQFANDSYYLFRQGSVTNLENLSLDISNNWNPKALWISASDFSNLKSVSVNRGGVGGWGNLVIDVFGSGQNFKPTSLISTDGIRKIDLQGSFGDVDLSNLTLPFQWDFNYSGFTLWSADNVQLSDGDDALLVYGDNSVNLRAGGGNDRVLIQAVSSLNEVYDGGEGSQDILDLSTLGYADITNAAITGFETINQGSTTLLMTQAQANSLTLQGDGRKYIKSSGVVSLTNRDDSFVGTGTESVSGGRGNDYISTVKTAVFTGNFSDYDMQWQNGNYVVQHARGSLADGTDTLNNVLQISFGDTTSPIRLDDNFNNFLGFEKHTFVNYQLDDGVDKRISARKDYNGDVDVFTTNLVPSSPFYIQGSTQNGNGWHASFIDLASGQQLAFRSLVNGAIYWEYYSWMDANLKWVPVFNTPDGFVAYQGGNVYFNFNVDGDAQNYAFTLKYLDDYSDNKDTLGQMDPLKGQIKGYIGDISDVDWIRTSLIKGTLYEFNLQGLGSGKGTLANPSLSLFDSQGRRVESGFDLTADVVGQDDKLVFRPTETGTYYLQVKDTSGIYTGSWTLTQESLDTIAGDISTTARAEWSTDKTFSVSSEVNKLGDQDWFRVWLDQGMTYEFHALGASTAMGNTLANPLLSLYSVTGNLLEVGADFVGTDDRLVYQAPDSGWYFLALGASGNTSKGTYTITGSSLKDDFGNTFSTAGVISVGATVHGTISYNDDTDWLKVGLIAGQTYRIDLTSDNTSSLLDPLRDPLLVIRNSLGQVVAEADDFGTQLNARSYFTATTSGLYYLEAKSAFKFDVGAWALKVDLAPADDYASDLSLAISSRPPSNLGLLTLTGQTPAVLSGEIGMPGDIDLFKVNLQANTVYQVTAEGFASHKGTLADPYVRLFDSSGHLVAFDDDDGVGTDAQFYVAPSTSGDYYIQVSTENSKAIGTYQVSVAARNIVADEAAGDVSTKAVMSVGDAFKGNLLTHGDTDWVRIQLNQGQDYVFRAQGASSGQGTLIDPALEIRAADGTLVGGNDNGLISKDASTLFTPQASGTYFLVVKSGDPLADTGTYTLVSRAPDDYSDTASGATSLSLGQTLQGGIQWATGSFGVRAQDSLGLATDMDVDWFKIHANAGQVLSVTVTPTTQSTLSRPMVEIITSDLTKRTIAIGDGLETASGSAIATFKSVSAGDYYVRIVDGAGATGNYSINLAEGDASDEDRNGPIGLTLKTIEQGGVTTQNANIGLAGDSDSFTFQAVAGHNYRVETLPLRDGAHAPLSGSHLSVDMAQAGVAGSKHFDNTILDQTPSAFEGAVFKADVAGIVTLSVSAAQSFQTGQYQVRVTDLGNGVDDHADRIVDVPKDSHGAVLSVMAGNDTALGEINSGSDVDLFAIQLTQGNVYDLSVLGYADGLGTLGEAGLKLLDANGNMVTSGDFDSQSGRTQLEVAVFDSGLYYVAVSGIDKVLGSLGSYTLQSRVQDLAYSGPDDWTSDAKTAAVVAPGRAVNGRIEHDIDHDWISANLTNGHTYVVDVLGNGSGVGGTLKDGYLRILDASGNEVAADDNSGSGNDSRIIIQASATGSYYFDVSSRDGGLGSYTVRLRELYSGTADPLKSNQWYLDALHLPELQGQFSGAGVEIGMVDDGIDTSHPDLQSQIDFALSYDAVYKTTDGKNKIPYPTYPTGDFHGTAVAGIMVAAANNDTGIAGIAYEAEVASTRVKWSWNQIVDALGKQYQFDVSNNSWGTIDPFTDSFNDTTLTFAYQAIRHAVQDGRHGLGTVMVFSAGNSASYGANTNYSNFANAREVITVGAVDKDGSAAPFSTPGANVLVSAYGVDLLTTDRHEAGLGLNTSGNYTSFSGTSAAAPVVSAVVALMLEANPNLGYRDVQEILAYSASHPADQSWKENAAHNFNLGGLSFNDKLGFGVVNAYAAVQLAQTWTGHNTAVNEVVSSDRAFGLHDAISDSGKVYSRTFTLSGDMTVDHVELGVDLRHTRMGDLVIELVSPNGTVSRLMDRPTVNPEQPYGLSGIDSNVPTHLLWDFSSVQFMGEKVAGDWTVNITDVRPEQTGTIQSLSLRAYGSADHNNDTYVFNDEGFVASGGLMGTLSDEFGHDTLNDSMMLQSVAVDLTGHTMTSNGAFYRISDWTQIEDVITGAADDTLTGNELDNLLSGRAGNDTLIGGKGADTLDGGAGTDTVIYAGKKDDYSVSFDAKAKKVHVVDNNKANGDDGNDTLINIEKIKFSDQELSLSNTVGNRAPIINRHFFDQPIKIDKGDGVDLHLPDDIFVDPDIPVPSDPIAPAPVNPGTPDAPVVQGSTIGEVLFSLAYFNGYDANSDVAVAHVSCQLKQGLNLQDLHVATNHIEINGRAISNTSTIQILNVTQDGQTANFDIRIDPTKLNANELVESLDFSLNFEPSKVNTDSVLVDLTSSSFGISNVLERKNPSLDNLDITATREDGSNLPDWLYFDPVSRKFVGTPPDNFQGQIKVLIQAMDEYGLSSSGVIKLQFGDNQAPVLEAARSIEILEGAPLLALNIAQPVDPEGTKLSVTIDSTPVLGSILKADGGVVKPGDLLTPAELIELHYQTTADANGNAGSLSYTVTDADGAVASSSVKIFVDAVNDAPRFGLDSKLIINYPGSEDLVLDLNKPTDPESIISTVTISDLPVLGQASLNGQMLQLGQIVSVSDLSKVHFSLRENVNGPIGSIGLQATDDQGLSTTWHLELEVKGTSITSSGTAGDDILYGSINADNLYGLAGNDTLIGNPGDDRLVGGTGNDSLMGGSGNDALDGGSGDDTLDGSAGADYLAGGPGNDLYYVDNVGDRVVETLPKGAGGLDTVMASINFLAPSNVENLTATGNESVNLTGNELDNLLVGNAQDNMLLGGSGADTLIGGAGNDTLNGGSGIDKMAGGTGNDAYYVDTRFDVILENQGEGTDTVFASCNYTLAANLENLILLPGGDWSGAGNSLANRIVGNDGNNLLSGGLGADTLEGGLGDDIYVLSDNLDTIIDTGGIDTVRSANSIDLTRLPTIERAELIGISSNTLTGNSLDNELVGNAGDNFLDGGAGVDRLTGSLGGDGFYVGYNGTGKLADVITDFDASQQDFVLVDVSTLGVNMLQAIWAQSGFVSASSFVKADGAVAHDSDDFFLLDTARGVLSFDSDGSGAKAAIAIARFEGDSYKTLATDTLYLSV
jgi:Ca2+-binding RTX toxin-like protein